MTLIRKFNDEGLLYFREHLDVLRSNNTLELDRNLINNEDYTIILYPETNIEFLPFTSKLQMAEYLYPRLNTLSLENKFYDAGLWSWLSIFYFDVICPVDKNGDRSIKEIQRYIPDKKINWRNYYRHLIALPLRIYDFHRDMPKILYSSEPDKVGEVVEEIASRQDIVMNGGILEAANLLYWNKNKQSSKPSITTKNRPGNIRRFVAVIQQLDLTYDLQSMSGGEIIKLLPQHEFERWID